MAATISGSGSIERMGAAEFHVETQEASVLATVAANINDPLDAVEVKQPA
jgi:hypothetical protein